MKIKYFSLAFILVLCFTFLVGCKSYNVEYINEHMNNEGDVIESSNYRRAIYSGEVLMFEETVISTIANDVYNQVVKTKELAGLDSETGYTETSLERTASLSSIKNALQLKEEYFEKSHLKVSETTLNGVLDNRRTLEVLGISSATDVSISVYLYDDLSLKSININYIDVNTNFNVCISVEYKYINYSLK